MGKLVEQRNKELEQENQKLKQMLKKVADDAEGLFAELDEAREKAVPTAPENVETSTLMDGYVWWTCRACGNLQHTDKQVRYCADCGQRVKWEDAEG